MTVKKRRKSISSYKIKLLRLQPKKNSCFIGSIDEHKNKHDIKLAMLAVIWQRVIKHAMNRAQVTEIAKLTL